MPNLVQEVQNYVSFLHQGGNSMVVHEAVGVVVVEPRRQWHSVQIAWDSARLSHSSRFGFDSVVECSVEARGLRG